MVFRTAVFLKQISFLKTELTNNSVQFSIKKNIFFISFSPIQFSSFCPALGIYRSFLAPLLHHVLLLVCESPTKLWSLEREIRRLDGRDVMAASINTPQAVVLLQWTILPKAQAEPSPCYQGLNAGNLHQVSTLHFIHLATSCLPSHLVHAISQWQPVKDEVSSWISKCDKFQHLVANSLWNTKVTELSPNQSESIRISNCKLWNLLTILEQNDCC